MAVTIRAVKYKRISDDREGRELGVTRQDEDLDALAARLGVTIVGDYTDNDIGASTRTRKRIPRTGYNAMMAAGKAGEYDMVLAYTTGRITRRPRENEDLIELAEQYGVQFQYVASPSFDLNTAAGRRIARILAANDAGEAEDISERSRREARQRAERGEMPRGGHRPFGYMPNRGHIDEAEAGHIREAARRLLEEGATVRGLVAEWNAAGVTSSIGNRWTPHTFRRMMMSPRISGRRTHLGNVVAEGGWPAIVTPDQSDRLRELLGDPARRLNHHGWGRIYLLTGGLAVCWRCGHKLIARAAAEKDTHVRSYVCAEPNHGLHHTHADGSPLPPDVQGRTTCGNGRLRIKAEPFEEFVREAVFAVLDSPELHAALRSDTGAEAGTASLWRELDAAQRRADELDDDYYVRGSITDKRQYERLRANQRHAMDEIRAKLDRAQADAGRRTLPVGSDRARELWAERGLEWRRQLIETVVEKITLGPGVRGLNKFDHRRVTIVWRY